MPTIRFRTLFSALREDCNEIAAVKRRNISWQTRPGCPKFEEKQLAFPWPEKPAAPVVPVFLPFAGCRTRCLFCAQDRQTGGESGIALALDRLDAEFARRVARQAPPAEAAFYGGTFTALPPELQEACLRRLAPWREKGAVYAARCSTRPDAVDAKSLARLQALGLGTVELGVQSFSSRALHAAGRGYDGERAEQACAAVRQAGLRLGVQLMPGMPGSEALPDASVPASRESASTDECLQASAKTFQADLRRALACGADFLRLYPCLVVEGTGLAELWRAGRHHPWPLEHTVAELAKALLAAGERGVPIIRMGLPLEKEFTVHILAGPAHPALGSLVRAEALYLYLAPHLAGNKGRIVILPARCRGFFQGHQNGLAARWEALGLCKNRVVFTPGAASCNFGGSASPDAENDARQERNSAPQPDKGSG